MKKSPKLEGNQIKELRNLISHKDSSSEEIKRAQAIIMVDKEMDVEAISEITNFRRSQIFGLRKKYLVSVEIVYRMSLRGVKRPFGSAQGRLHNPIFFGLNTGIASLRSQ